MGLVYVSPGGLAAVGPGPGPGPNPPFDRTITVAASSDNYGVDRVPGFPSFGYGAISNANFGPYVINVVRYRSFGGTTFNFNLRLTTPGLTPAPSDAFSAVSVEWSGGFEVYQRADSDDPLGSTGGIARSWLWTFPSEALVRWLAPDAGQVYQFGIA
ncbi:MAG: hypothetical protein V2J02_03600 [Pseudomonadales bacterium]|jgi:hypothetical protein|nr:hypothetical protein [Pseudomonadales bacterium]